MKKLLLSLIVIASTATQAHAARCLFVPRGWLYVNHYSRFAVGPGYKATLACSRGAPTAMYLSGGSLCRGRTLFGRTAWNRPFSCKVRAVWR